MCDFCKGRDGKSIKVGYSKDIEFPKINEVQILQLDNDVPGIMLWNRGIPEGYFDINYCPICGRDLIKKEVKE